MLLVDVDRVVTVEVDPVGGPKVMVEDPEVSDTVIDPEALDELDTVVEEIGGEVDELEIIEDETDVVNELEELLELILEESESEYEVLLPTLVVLVELPDDTRRRNIVPTSVASIRVPTLDFR